MPRPHIVGTLVRQIDMNHTGVTAKGRRSNKDYRITLSVDAGGLYHLYTEYGPAGRLQNGEEHVLGATQSAGSCDRCADDLRDAKQNQRDSYRVVNDQYFHLAPPAAPKPTAPPAAAPRQASPPRQIKSIESLSANSRRAITNIF